jgi:membrane protease YdiL (CAAX protease family)
VSLFIALFVVSIVYVAMHGMTAVKAQQLDSDLRLVLPIQLFSYIVMVVVMYGTVRVRYERPFLDAIAWNWSRIRVWAFVAAGLGLAIIAQLSEIVLRMPKDLPIQKAFSTTTGAYLIGIFGVLIAPFVEELFFRGFLYPVAARSLRSAGQTALALALLCGVIGVASSSAREHMLYVAVAVAVIGGVLVQANSGAGELAQSTRFRIQSISGIAITGVAFALVHAAQLGYSWTPLLVMFVVGASLTTIRAVSRSVAASTIAHVTYNFVLMATLWIATDHFRHLEQIGR